MELIYSMRRKPLKCEPPHFESASDSDVVRPICTISSGNIIAFSSPTELSDTDGDTWSGHVYVCDLDTPWDSHKVVSTTHPVSALEWDSEGRQLLVATTEGSVSVFVQKEFLLNEWTRAYSANFPGERIMAAVFFHTGRRLVALDKKDAPVPERVQATSCTPTLRGRGGVAVPGACVVSATALLGALLEGAAASADSLRAHRDRLTHASFAHKNGNLLIAAVCVSDRGRAVVRCAVVSVSGGGGGGAAGGGGAPLLHAQPLPSVTSLPPFTRMPTSITWCLREDTDSLLVAGGTLTLWKLAERAHPVHKLLAKGPVQGSTTPGGGPKPASDCFNTLVWQQTGVWGIESGSWCAHVASARLALGPPHALLCTAGKLHLLAHSDHHYICSRVVNTAGPDAAAASPPKKSKYNNGASESAPPLLSCCDMSWLGGVAVAVDTRAQLHVFKLPLAAKDIPTPVSVQQTCGLLEYAMLGGYDALDVLLTLKHSAVEAVYERLTETFQRQPPQFQQYYFHTWLKMRIALLRLLPTASVSVSWLTCLGTLWATWAAASGALRVDDKPDDKLLAALLDLHHADHDKALLALESKAELPCETAALAALRRPLQRARDIALTALAAAAPHAPHAPHGYELWADPVGVSLLRKLVVLARGAGAGAGAGGAGGAPPEHALSRLLARLHPPIKQDLLEEIAGVCAQSPARVWEALPRAAVSAPHGTPYPLYLEYGSAPECVRVRPEPPPAASTDATPACQMDAIRYMYLSLVGRWRGCGRCGARALAPAMPARHPLQRAHDARFLPHCRCGGKWTLVTRT